MFEKIHHARSNMLEAHFQKFRQGIIGHDQKIETIHHASSPVVYTDWTASGRLYGPIEDRMREVYYPLVANTHTDTNFTGSFMTLAYHEAQLVIKQHVGASENDLLISGGSGMTGVINKFQRILGMRIHEAYKGQLQIPADDRPVIFVTHMEHHSNQTTWLETIGEVVVVPPDDRGLVSVENFKKALERYPHRSQRIAAITSCSNVTGIMTPYMDIAAIFHKHGGYCFVDFACSGPYVKIDMHDDDASGRYLDAIYLSPHKFLGGPGTSGILVFNGKLYRNAVPDNPGGGTVNWTNPWGEHSYLSNVEAREDGGTPPFLQTIRTAMCMRLKDEMGVSQIRAREEEILDIIWRELEPVSNLQILAGEHRDRLGVVSFVIDGLHYNVGVKMLNDRYGIQMRGGCSCAGTYGHYLLKVNQSQSRKITSNLDQGDCSLKPGWIRMSIHPTHTNEEILYVTNALKQLAEHHKAWAADYNIDLSADLIACKDPRIQERMRRSIRKSFEEPFSADVSLNTEA